MHILFFPQKSTHYTWQNMVLSPSLLLPWGNERPMLTEPTILRESNNPDLCVLSQYLMF